MFSKKRLIFVGVLFLIFIFSFLILRQRVSQDHSDDSILSQYPCKVPCWHNLVPGETSLEEARRSLANDEFADNVSEYISTSQPERTDLYWGDGNRLIFFDNILKLIMIKPYLDFSLQDILDVYGIPSGTQVNYLPAASTYDTTITISLYYPEDGMTVDFEIFKGDLRTRDKFDLSPTLPGIAFRLNEKATSLEEFLPKTVGERGIVSPDYIEQFVTLGLPDISKSVIQLAYSEKGELVPQIVTPTPSD